MRYPVDPYRVAKWKLCQHIDGKNACNYEPCIAISDASAFVETNVWSINEEMMISRWGCEFLFASTFQYRTDQSGIRIFTQTNPGDLHRKNIKTANLELMAYTLLKESKYSRTPVDSDNCVHVCVIISIVHHSGFPFFSVTFSTSSPTSPSSSSWYFAAFALSPLSPNRFPQR